MRHKAAGMAAQHGMRKDDKLEMSCTVEKTIMTRTSQKCSIFMVISALVLYIRSYSCCQRSLIDTLWREATRFASLDLIIPIFQNAIHRFFGHSSIMDAVVYHYSVYFRFFWRLLRKQDTWPTFRDHSTASRTRNIKAEHEDHHPLTLKSTWRRTVIACFGATIRMPCLHGD